MISAKIYITQNDNFFQTELTPLNVKTVEEAQALLEKLLSEMPEWRTAAIFENGKFAGSVGKM